MTGKFLVKFPVKKSVHDFRFSNDYFVFAL